VETFQAGFLGMMVAERVVLRYEGCSRAMMLGARSDEHDDEARKRVAVAGDVRLEMTHFHD
jgi:hypothetical protein